MLNNRYIHIRILQINRESIITLLNKLPYIPDSRCLKNLKSYLQVAIKLLKVEYWL